MTLLKLIIAESDTKMHVSSLPNASIQVIDYFPEANKFSIIEIGITSHLH